MHKSFKAEEEEMTKLYVLYYWYEYEGGKIVGIYTDNKKALKHAERIKDKGDGRSIQVVEANKEIDITI